MAGPRMVAAWKVVAFHATARGNNSRGTSNGNKDRPAGALNERTIPNNTKTAKIGRTSRKPRREISISAMEQRANPA